MYTNNINWRIRFEYNNELSILLNMGCFIYKFHIENQDILFTRDLDTPLKCSFSNLRVCMYIMNVVILCFTNKSFLGTIKTYSTQYDWRCFYACIKIWSWSCKLQGNSMLSKSQNDNCGKLLILSMPCQFWHLSVTILGIISTNHMKQRRDNVQIFHLFVTSIKK